MDEYVKLTTRENIGHIEFFHPQSNSKYRSYRILSSSI